MTTIERHEPGTPAWADVMTPAPDKARAFYAALFGWSFSVGGPESGFYTMCKVGERNAAGMAKLQEGAPYPSVWTVYFAVQDADATAEAIKNNGGQLMMGPMDVLGEGRMAIAADATGAVFGLWQPMRHTGAQLVDEPGSIVWHEVNTRDANKARDFYGNVFGLTSRQVEAPMTYFTLHLGKKPVGGVMQMNESFPAQVPPHWLTYFGVSDTDAALEQVRQLGGNVIKAAMDTPYGRLAIVSDPFGAVFAIIQPAGG